MSCKYIALTVVSFSGMTLRSSTQRFDSEATGSVSPWLFFSPHAVTGSNRVIENIIINTAVIKFFILISLYPLTISVYKFYHQSTLSQILSSLGIYVFTDSSLNGLSLSKRRRRLFNSSKGLISVTRLLVRDNV